jgi:hypothetical protein
MSSNPNPFFRLADFHSLEISLDGANLTSRVRISKGSIALTEIHATGISVEVPPRSCSVGHHLELTISVKKPVGDQIQHSKFQVTGTIEEVEGDTKGRQQVRIFFRQYSREDWDALLEYLAGKQEAANRLIRSTRR